MQIIKEVNPIPSRCAMCQYVECLLLLLLPLVECWCMYTSATSFGKAKWSGPHQQRWKYEFKYHSVTCYTKYIISRMHVYTTKLRNITCTLAAIGVILRSLEYMLIGVWLDENQRTRWHGHDKLYTNLLWNNVGKNWHCSINVILAQYCTLRASLAHLHQIFINIKKKWFGNTKSASAYQVTKISIHANLWPYTKPPHYATPTSQPTSSSLTSLFLDTS